MDLPSKANGPDSQLECFLLTFLVTYQVALHGFLKEREASSLAVRFNSLQIMVFIPTDFLADLLGQPQEHLKRTQLVQLFFPPSTFAQGL